MFYHESDHVLNLAYNALCNGDCLQDIELRRNDVNFLDALGAQRIPDPTTAGDFCRRFTPETIHILQDVYDKVRVGVWRKQPDAFSDRAILDADGTLVPTDAEHKEGVDIAYDGSWSYHPLLVTLANTGEVMRLVNRSGNRPSHEGAADALDRARATCRKGLAEDARNRFGQQFGFVVGDNEDRHGGGHWDASLGILRIVTIGR